jgi:hypothetical protein
MVLDTNLRELPAGAGLRFDASTGTVLVEWEEGRVALLRVDGIGPDEVQHLEAVFADPGLPGSINTLSRNLAVGLLCVQVEPCRDWRVWRDAMKAVAPELLHTLSSFGHRACLLPALAPSLTQAGRRMEERMERIVPRDEPKIDWSWSELGGWRDLLGRGFQTALS